MREHTNTFHPLEMLLVVALFMAAGLVASLVQAQGPLFDAQELSRRMAVELDGLNTFQVTSEPDPDCPTYVLEDYPLAGCFLLDGGMRLSRFAVDAYLDTLGMQATGEWSNHSDVDSMLYVVDEYFVAVVLMNRGNMTLAVTFQMGEQ